MELIIQFCVELVQLLSVSREHPAFVRIIHGGISKEIALCVVRYKSCLVKCRYFAPASLLALKRFLGVIIDKLQSRCQLRIKAGLDQLLEIKLGEYLRERLSIDVYAVSGSTDYILPRSTDLLADILDLLLRTLFRLLVFLR